MHGRVCTLVLFIVCCSCTFKQHMINTCTFTSNLFLYMCSLPHAISSQAQSKPSSEDELEPEPSETYVFQPKVRLQGKLVADNTAICILWTHTALCVGSKVNFYEGSKLLCHRLYFTSVVAICVNLANVCKLPHYPTYSPTDPQQSPINFFLSLFLVQWLVSMNVHVCNSYMYYTYHVAFVGFLKWFLVTDCY